MDTNLSLFKIFLEVAEAGSISGAAKKLFISQPAISKSISNLEENMNTTLFQRNSRGVSLTDEGQLLYQHVVEAFRTLEAGELEIQRYKDLGIGHLNIGVSTTLCRFILLPYLSGFIQQNPHISINIQCQSTNQTLELLQEGTIDIGVVARQSQMKNMDFYSYGEIEDIFVATPDYLKHLKERMVGDPENGYDILNEGTVMLLDKGNATRQFIDYFIEENHIHPANLIEITTMDLLMEFARTGLGIACVISDFVKDDIARGDLIQIPTHQALHHREIGFVWGTKHTPHRSLRSFIDYIESDPLTNNHN